MDLYTPHFGWISYDPQDMISFTARDEVGAPESAESRWLLLADRTHPSLYWLQSLSDPARYHATCAVSEQITADQLRIVHEAGLPEWVNDSPVIALAKMTQQGKAVQIDFEQPILIDPRSRNGFHATAIVRQTLQHEWSDQLETLRECA